VSSLNGPPTVLTPQRVVTFPALAIPYQERRLKVRMAPYSIDQTPPPDAILSDCGEYWAMVEVVDPD
jgi:type II secretory pathway component PulL